MGTALLLSVAALRAQADQTDYDRDLLVLKGKRAVETRILRVEDQQIVYLQGSRETTVPKTQVESFERSLDLLPEFLRKCQGASGKDAASLCALARWCGEKRLRKLAQVAWLEALCIEPQNEEANKALGHVKGAKGWEWPHEGGLYSFAELAKRRQDWGEAWELSSLHYDLRTDAPLQRALQLLRDLEWFYHSFFALYGEDLALDDRPERLTVHVYKDHAKVPKPSSTVAAYFDGNARILFTGFEGGRVDAFPVGLDHESTHQVLMHTMRFRATGGSIPCWLHEGMAEYVRTILLRGRPGGEPKVDFARRDESLFKTAAAGREYRLERVLTMDSSDFSASTGQAEKYATSYAWVHFLQWGDAGAQRKKFFEFVKEAYVGKGTSSTFKKIMGADLPKLKKSFESYLTGG
jgi:hypothetical protein